MPDKRNGYDLDADLLPIIKGDVPIPNLELTDMRGAIADIAALGHRLVPMWGHAKMDGYKRWAFYFLTPGTGVGSGLDGGGYVMLYWGYPDGGKIGTFAICKHEKRHPGHCAKCGLDMEIDHA